MNREQLRLKLGDHTLQCLNDAEIDEVIDLCFESFKAEAVEALKLASHNYGYGNILTEEEAVEAIKSMGEK